MMAFLAKLSGGQDQRKVRERAQAMVRPETTGHAISRSIMCLPSQTNQKRKKTQEHQSENR
jgi:hypothetical protein